MMKPTSERETAFRLVSSLGVFGIRPTKIAALSGIDVKRLRDVLRHKADPTPAMLSRLEQLLADTVNERFAQVARAAMLGGDCPAVVRACGPAAARLHNLLDVEADRHAAAVGWPRGEGE